MGTYVRVITAKIMKEEEVYILQSAACTKKKCTNFNSVVV